METSSTRAPLVDSFGRVADDLRISVTDRCNFRCTYCMPAEGLAWLPRSEILTFEETTRLLRVFRSLGVRSIKVTGGEPTVRADLPTLVAMFREAGPELETETRDDSAARPAAARPQSMAPIRVYEVATFYTMFNLRPVGRYLLQACTTTPCWLRGSDEVVRTCEKKLGVGMGSTTSDGVFTLVEVECLGACVNAPILQVNDDFYEDLDGPATEALLDALRDGKPPIPGSVIGRHSSEPIGGRGTLTE